MKKSAVIPTLLTDDGPLGTNTMAGIVQFATGMFALKDIHIGNEENISERFLCSDQGTSRNSLENVLQLQTRAQGIKRYAQGTRRRVPCDSLS